MHDRDELGSTNLDEEKSLREKIERSELVLDDLERDLAAADAELEMLAEKTQQYTVLREVCRTLEELDSLEALHLFWGRRSAMENQAEHLENARRSMQAFTEEVAQAEQRRQSVIDEVFAQNEALDYLDYDLRDFMEHAEAANAEWLVECEEHPTSYRPQIMPWARATEEDQRARGFVAVSVLWCLLLGLIFPLVDLPIPELSQLIEIPERVAKLIREEMTPPPPPAPVEEPIVPEEVPDPLLAEETPPEEVPAVVEQPVVAEVKQPDTREQVKTKGILAFRDSFASRATSRPTAQLGSQARVRSAGQDAVGRPERSMVTTSAPGSSGGINLANLSRDVGGDGQAIEGVELTRVASTIGGDEGPDRPLASRLSAGRTDEEIQIVFDRYKAALYRLYNRELRKDPTLRGQLILRLTIEPDGSVSLCQLQSSDMEAPALAQQVVDRVSNFDFGAKEDIIAMTIIYPIDFLPAA